MMKHCRAADMAAHLFKMFFQVYNISQNVQEDDLQHLQVTPSSVNTDALVFIYVLLFYIIKKTLFK